MKRQNHWAGLAKGLGLAALLLSSPFSTGAQAATPPIPSAPSIVTVRVEQSDIVVTVQVPPGLRRLTLEARTRLGAGAWVPKAVERSDGAGGLVRFRLPRSAQLEMLRVRGDDQEPLPASFYRGRTEYAGPQQASPPGSTGGWGPGGWRDGIFPETAGPGGDGGAREVVESDIWVVRGSTVYFFNQYRGLQVIDLTNPEAPVVKVELPLPAAGEQMYVLDDRHVVLLARSGCGWNAEEGSQILVVALDETAPQIVGRIALPGTVAESRLVGQALYLATQAYRRVIGPPNPDGGGDTWEWGSQLSSIDLADPARPVLRSTLWYAGYGNVISATDRFLFITTQHPQNWWQSLIQVVDIARPDGTMNALATLRPAGRVADKFKMNLAAHAVHGDVFTVISEDSGNQGTVRASVLETYSLATPTAPRRLGRIEVGHGEGLFATRFDGDRAYLVTFLRIDPLWVVDLSDPARPRLCGELQVPGWSTYIKPLGDRLVSIGIDNSNSWRVAVSLFDVRDPSHPALLAKLPLGDQYSWSEANWDEKAFTVLPEAGLILVPYQGWSSSGYASRVQLIDLGPTTLTARGVIEHQMQPRRATAVGSHIVSVSGRELLVVEAADRDHPKVLAARELSWGVNRVLLAGDYLLELTDATGWGDNSTPAIRVATRSAPNLALVTHALESPWPVLGAAVKEGRLFVLQGSQTDYLPPGDDGTKPPPPPNVRLSVLDLDALPTLKVASTTDATIDAPGWLPSFKALWLKPGLVVWASDQSFYPFMMDGWRWGGGPLWWPGWGWGGSGRFLAFQWSDLTPPQLVSDVNLFEAGEWWGSSSAFTAGTLVYLSHQQGVLISDPRDGHWETRYFLDVIDYADPATPTVRKPINLPGRLSGVAIDGSLLYTQGPHYDAQGGSDGSEFLDAVAYDGVAASLVTSLKLAPEWPRAVLVNADVVLLARPENGTSAGLLESWAVATEGAQAGQFVRQAQLKLARPAESLAAFGRLLAAPGGRSIDLFDLTDPSVPKPVTTGTMDSCAGWDLSRADGALELGLWMPLQDYGVFGLPLRQ